MSDTEQRLAALEAKLHALEDQVALYQLMSAYGPLVDSGDAEATAAMWTEDGVYDWGGGLVWLTMPVGASADAHAEAVRRLLPSGHATLMRAPPDIRAKEAVFQPAAPALAALQSRVKAAFDPHGILAPNFMTVDS